MLLLTIDVNLLESGRSLEKRKFSFSCSSSKKAIIRVNLSIEIIPVKSTCKVVDLFPSIIAQFGVIVCLNVVEVVVTIVCLESVKQVLWDDVKVVHDFWVSRRDIKVPVSGTISYDEALKIVGLHA
jgi:hypothetical protein